MPPIPLPYCSAVRPLGSAASNGGAEYALSVFDPVCEPALARSQEGWHEVWARVTYENVTARYPKILARLAD